jgi:hypothetical protein
VVRVDAVPTSEGWSCQVRVDAGGRSSNHLVTVTRANLERWGGGGTVEELVTRSFEFLLEREPPSSILPRFELSVIQRYFPEYDQDFRR